MHYYKVVNREVFFKINRSRELHGLGGINGPFIAKLYNMRLLSISNLFMILLYYNVLILAYDVFREDVLKFIPPSNSEILDFYFEFITNI